MRPSSPLRLQACHRENLGRTRIPQPRAAKPEAIQPFRKATLSIWWRRGPLTSADRHLDGPAGSRGSCGRRWGAGSISQLAVFPLTPNFADPRLLRRRRCGQSTNGNTGSLLRRDLVGCRVSGSCGVPSMGSPGGKMSRALRIGARVLLIGSLLLPAVGCACLNHAPPPAPAPPPPPPPPNDGTGKGSHSENNTNADSLVRVGSNTMLKRAPAA